MSTDKENAFLNHNENNRIVKRHQAGIDWSDADKSKMIQYLVEHLTTSTDDDLTAAASGETSKSLQ